MRFSKLTIFFSLTGLKPHDLKSEDKVLFVTSMEHLGLHKHFCKSNVILYWVHIQLNHSILSISNTLESVDHAASSAKTHEKSENLRTKQII